MKGSQGTTWRCGGRPGQTLDASAARVAHYPVVLAPFSTGLPPEILDRLRVAAPQLRLGQGEITVPALDLDRFLAEGGY
jgi:hypothetical protein